MGCEVIMSAASPNRVNYQSMISRLSQALHPDKTRAEQKQAFERFTNQLDGSEIVRGDEVISQEAFYKEWASWVDKGDLNLWDGRDYPADVRADMIETMTDLYQDKLRLADLAASRVGAPGDVLSADIDGSILKPYDHGYKHSKIMTREDLLRILTRDDLTAQQKWDILTRDDCWGLLTRDDIKNILTRDDFRRILTRDDLKKILTRDDLLSEETKRLLTRDDLTAQKQWDILTRDDLLSKIMTREDMLGIMTREDMLSAIMTRSDVMGPGSLAPMSNMSGGMNVMNMKLQRKAAEEDEQQLPASPVPPVSEGGELELGPGGGIARIGELPGDRGGLASPSDEHKLPVSPVPSVSVGRKGGTTRWEGPPKRSPKIPPSAPKDVEPAVSVQDVMRQNEITQFPNVKAQVRPENAPQPIPWQVRIPKEILIACAFLGISLGVIYVLLNWGHQDPPHLNELRYPGIAAGCVVNGECEDYFGEDQDNCPADCLVQQDSPAEPEPEQEYEESQDAPEPEPVEEEEPEQEYEESKDAPEPEPAEDDEPEPLIEYEADTNEIAAYECFTLNWYAENVESVTFGGITDKSPPLEGDFRLCSQCETKTYPLTVTYNDGSQEKFYQTISVVSGSCGGSDSPDEPPPQDSPDEPPPQDAPDEPAPICDGYCGDYTCGNCENTNNCPHDCLPASPTCYRDMNSVDCAAAVGNYVPSSMSGPFCSCPP
jgi:hypothetical protein